MLYPIRFNDFNAVVNLNGKFYPKYRITGFNLGENTLIKSRKLSGFIKIPLNTFKKSVICCIFYPHNVVIYILMLVLLYTLKLTNFSRVKHKIRIATNTSVFCWHTLFVFPHIKNNDIC